MSWMWALFREPVHVPLFLIGKLSQVLERDLLKDSHLSDCSHPTKRNKRENINLRSPFRDIELQRARINRQGRCLRKLFPSRTATSFGLSESRPFTAGALSRSGTVVNTTFALLVLVCDLQWSFGSIRVVVLRVVIVNPLLS